MRVLVFNVVDVIRRSIDANANIKRGGPAVQGRWPPDPCRGPRLV